MRVAILPRYPEDFRLFLASQSPRRRDLLAAVGIPFDIVPSVADEVLDGGPATALAERNALAKARGASLPAGTPAGAFVLGVDTVVVVDGRALGKPEDEDHARGMLERLSGRSHEVVSGVALLRVAEAGSLSAREGAGGTERVAHAVTTVSFRSLTPSDVSAYVTSREWTDKAGGYAIQGRAALFVEGIVGDYANVVGLPLALVGAMFREEGFDVVTGSWRTEVWRSARLPV
ncbi:MAG: septum formation protein Maf [Actinobacteria bacterium]|nr:septum formation protein Maf [Actinomycetota bacterium]